LARQWLAASKAKFAFRAVGVYAAYHLGELENFGMGKIWGSRAGVMANKQDYLQRLQLAIQELHNARQLTGEQ